MSEYIEIETEMSDDRQRMHFYTNLKLTEQGKERYETVDRMEVGSPVAQALAVVPGIVALRIVGDELTITREPEAEWHTIVADVSAALKDFFL